MIGRRSHRRVAFAILIVGMLLAVSVGATLTPQADENDSDATPGFFAGLVVGSLIGAGAGALAGYELAKAQFQDQLEELNRESEKNALYTSINSGIAHYNHAIQVYSNIWGLTSEHWIRQAELAATKQWEKDSAYDQTKIMEQAMIYQNAAMMMVNGTVQINAHFNEALSEHVKSWEDPQYEGVYADGNMVLRFKTGIGSMSLTGQDDWTARMGLLARDVVSGKDLVYFAGGEIYASEDTTITDMSTGKVYNLSAGCWTSINDPESMDDDGIFKLSPGVTYLGNFYPVFGASSAPLDVGFVVTKGDGTSMVLNYLQRNGIDYVSNGESTSDSFTVDIITKEKEVSSQEMLSILRNYDALLQTTWDVIMDADQAARVLWEIFDKAGKASAYLTTLTVPETYNNVQLTDVQKELVTVMAMKQLSDYWTENSGAIKSTDYRMTEDSLSLYCQGDVLVKGLVEDGEGNGKLLENVIYTPIFYTDHVLEKGGTTKVVRYAYVIVWADARENPLSSFDSTTFDDAAILFLEAGSEIYVKDMKYVNSEGTVTYPTTLDLDAKNIDYIRAEEIDVPDPTPTNHSDDLAQLLCLFFIALGVMMVASAVRSGNLVFIVIGLVVMALGFVLADPISDLLRVWGVHFEWPSIKLW